MRSSRLLTAVLATATAVIALAGCTAGGGSSSASDAPAKPLVVASTNVYGQLAQEIGGDLVDVTSIIDNAAQDPHEYEASTRDRLTVSKAALLIVNGGGYDGFMDGLISGSGNKAPVITAVESSHDWPGDATASPTAAASDGHDHGHDHGHGDFNEHVWYDLHTTEHVVEHIGEEIAKLVPAKSAEITRRTEALKAQISGLDGKVDALKSARAGTKVMLTEPIGGYLLSDAGLDDVTPEGFAEAVEEGQDVPPATLLAAIGLIQDGTVKVLAVNAQAAGAETQRLVAEAKTKGVPVVEFSETLPTGKTYVQWMTANVQALSSALGV